MKSYDSNKRVAIEQKFAIEQKLSGGSAVSKKLAVDKSAFAIPLTGELIFSLRSDA